MTTRRLDSNMQRMVSNLSPKTGLKSYQAWTSLRTAFKVQEDKPIAAADEIEFKVCSSVEEYVDEIWMTRQKLH